MRKLKLQLDHLRIESFDTAVPGQVQRGTIRAEEETAFGGSPDCSAYCGPGTWTQDPYDSRCCYTWALDSRCADSLQTSPAECACWPVE